ncbi:hypothetical protein PC129_g15564 [Phytophthora cactorum]|uniref:Uncharacterized protein n=1 Tax=Phytophthora cactorum TaxID=29920 RepID=A0A8T1HLA6_9STRA|nr:hypothetical protein Pcac1_g8072 [Phytophthora cactorum]KAG3003280.1 hypothetical protein PC119_g16064 [Phytophthora cactorum]KAG3213505.1 hypothetical protein PC129_g15564 [Phytophthora cactorum]
MEEAGNGSEQDKSRRQKLSAKQAPEAPTTQWKC